ncbi:hypothetical protein [Streptomyces murinus]|uniref:hypothetical protein n=1 Tax=Streptomyces murinus TaxID=33900 RepID=UPI0038211A4A
MNAPEEDCSNLDDVLFVAGVDYLSGWREADAAARQMNEVLAGLGLDTRLVRAVPHVGADGDPVVWLRPESARLIARALGVAE